MTEASCADCGLDYLEFGLDLLVRDSQWARLSPEDGILCANCMVRRARTLGAVVVRAVFDYGIPHEKECHEPEETT